MQYVALITEHGDHPLKRETTLIVGPKVEAEDAMFVAAKAAAKIATEFHLDGHRSAVLFEDSECRVYVDGKLFATVTAHENMRD